MDLSEINEVLDTEETVCELVRQIKKTRFPSFGDSRFMVPGY